MLLIKIKSSVNYTPRLQESLRWSNNVGGHVIDHGMSGLTVLSFLKVFRVVQKPGSYAGDAEGVRMCGGPEAETTEQLALSKTCSGNS